MDFTQTFTWQWLAMAAACIAIVYKIVPVIIQIFRNFHVTENGKENLREKVEKHDVAIREINEKLDRDYKKLNAIDGTLRMHGGEMLDSLEERKLIITSLLAVLKGLQEIGANGPTKEAQQNIEKYLIKESHELSEGDKKL